MATITKDEFTRDWITRNSIEICDQYEHGLLTIRSLHYQLVGRGMTNTFQHYKRVVGAMIEARRAGIIDYDQFSDHDRDVIGKTDYAETDLDDKIEQGKDNVKAWMNHYYRNRWENQPMVAEVWVEKKALQGIFQRPCMLGGVALAPCKGYPSLTFLRDAAERFRGMVQAGKTPIILYFGDYDPSGEDIPRSIEDNLRKDFGVPVEVRRFALMEEQVLDWGLPPAPAKVGDSRTAVWTGIGQVELDAVEPKKLQEMVTDAIESVFDRDLYSDLKMQEKDERKQYKSELRDYVIELGQELEDEDDEE